MTILHEKPIFSLKIRGAGSAFFIQVNNITVFHEFARQSQVELELPVNHWMRSGDNALRIDVLPPNPGEDISRLAEIAIELRVRAHGGDNSYPIASIVFDGSHLKDGDPLHRSSPEGSFSSAHEFSPDDNGDIQVAAVTSTPISEYDGGISYSRELNVPSSLPLWKFFESDDLPNYDAMSDEDYYAAMDTLFVEYEKIQKAIETSNVDSVMPLLEERNRETDAAYYLEPGTTEQGIKSDLIRASTSSDLELQELIPDYVGFTLEENRKLVSLTRNGLKSAIVLNYKSMSAAERFHFIYRREGDKWIISR